MRIESKEKGPQIKIVSAIPEDARGVAELFHKTWLATYPNEKAGITVDDVEDMFKDAFTDESLAKRTERMSQLKENETFFLAKDDDRVVGACNVVRHPDKNQLQSIYVLPEYQGREVGKLLWEEAQKHFDLGKDTIVQVATYNTNAIDFYKKIGFEGTGNEFQDEKFRMKSGAIISETEMVMKAKKEIS